VPALSGDQVAGELSRSVGGIGRCQVADRVAGTERPAARGRCPNAAKGVVRFRVTGLAKAATSTSDPIPISSAGPVAI
jgi:hypothetical protein